MIQFEKQLEILVAESLHNVICGGGIVVNSDLPN